MPIRSFTTVIAFFIGTLSTRAQTSFSSDTIPGKRIYRKKEPHSYNQVAYINALGPGCGVSLHYDIRFNGTYKGLGARIGFGYVPPYKEEYGGRELNDPVHTNYYKGKTTLPFGLNYVLTPSHKHAHMIEFGLGLTYMSGDSLWYDEVTTTYTWLGWMSVNYRRTIGKHLLMRVGVAAMASKSYVAPFPTPEWGMGFRF